LCKKSAGGKTRWKRRGKKWINSYYIDTNNIRRKKGGEKTGKEARKMRSNVFGLKSKLVAPHDPEPIKHRTTIRTKSVTQILHFQAKNSLYKLF
jgi:hypothetical protein